LRSSGGCVSIERRDTGFGDLSYFNRTFRRRFGCSPSQARAAARDDRHTPSSAA
jgi:AraC-like DNA-binding protein